jgi:hypothetical protein
MSSRKLRSAVTFWFPLLAAVAAAGWTVVTYFVPSSATERAPAASHSPPLAASVEPAASSLAPPAIAAGQAAPAVSATNGVAVGGNVDNSTISVAPGPD